MKRRVLSLFLCVVMLFTAVPLPANAVSAYDRKAALNFAANHWNDGIGLCAEFVSRCLNAGGVDTFNKSCTALVAILRKRSDCTEYTIPINSDLSVSIEDHPDKVSPGDPIFIHCSYQNNYQHALLANGMDENGLLKAYAHNFASDGTGTFRYYRYCPECGRQSMDYVTVFHFEDPPVLSGWFSESKQGSAAKHFDTGKLYYLNYKLYNRYTGELFDSYGSDAYRVSMEIYSPDKSLLTSHTYQSDSNWLSAYFTQAGTYTYKISITGDFSDTVTGSIEVNDRKAALTATENNIQLHLNQPSQTVVLALDGSYKGRLTAETAVPENSPFTAKLISFKNRRAVLTVSPNEIGQGDLSVRVFDDSKKIAAETIHITVIGTESKITYGANGGTDAPAAQSAYLGETILLSGQQPKGASYEVRFDTMGGEMSARTKVYSQSFAAWNTRADGAGESFLSGEAYTLKDVNTLYAQYDPCLLDDIQPTKEGYYFSGWYDSPESDEYGSPAGNRYAPGTEISQDLTLYAMWSKSETLLFGDMNGDGEISVADLEKLSAAIEGENSLKEEERFRGDLNANGKLDTEDHSLLEALSAGSLTQEELPAYQAAKEIRLEGLADVSFSYGKPISVSSLTLNVCYAENIVYSISEGLTLTGFDSHKLGVQTIQLALGQFSAACEVSVSAPEYLLNFHPKGGTVSPVQKRMTYGCALGELPIPVRAGYTFLG